MKDPSDKYRWLIDEEAAAVVQRIFALTIEGHGPYDIARILFNDKVEAPAVYQARQGRGQWKSRDNFSNTYNWSGFEESLKEIPALEDEKILEPDMGEIQEVSLESIEQCNIEKSAAKVDETSQKLRELTEEEKQKLREENNLPESLLNAIRVVKNGNYRVTCINEKYKDMENPDTGIRYVEKAITVNGVEITVVVPEFPTSLC